MLPLLLAAAAASSSVGWDREGVRTDEPGTSLMMGGGCTAVIGGEVSKNSAHREGDTER